VSNAHGMGFLGAKHLARLRSIVAIGVPEHGLLFFAVSMSVQM
jgi:hypothetical protein